MHLRHMIGLTVARSSTDVEDLEKINKEFHQVHEEDMFQLLSDARAYRLGSSYENLTGVETATVSDAVGPDLEGETHNGEDQDD